MGALFNRADSEACKIYRYICHRSYYLGVLARQLSTMASVNIGRCGKLLTLDGQLRGIGQVAQSCQGCETLHGALPYSRSKARAFEMFGQSLLSPQAQARSPLLVSSGASRAQRVSVHCRGLHGQQSPQHSWPLKLGSAGAGLAALAYLAVASPAGTRPPPLQALPADDHANDIQ